MRVERVVLLVVVSQSGSDHVLSGRTFPSSSTSVRYDVTSVTSGYVK